MNLLWRLGLRNLLRNKRRSFTTGIAIGAGFAGLSLLGSYVNRTQHGLQANAVYINQAGHVQLRKQGSFQNYSLTPKKYLIDLELDEKIQKLLSKYSGEIEFKGKYLTGAGLVIAGNVSQPFLARGGEMDVFYKAVHHPSVVRWAAGWIDLTMKTLTEDKLQNGNLISITPRLVDILNKPKGLENMNEEQRNVQLITRNFYNDLNAVNADLGLLHTTGVALAEDTSVRTSLKLLQDLFSTDGYQYMSIFLKDETKDRWLQSNLKKDIAEQNLPLEVFHFTESEIGEFYVGTMNFLYVMAGFFVFLIMGMVVLSIINSLTLGILERVRELGTLKALGFQGPHIVGIFVRETVWLSLFSVLLGGAVAQGVVEFVNHANFRFSPPAVEGDLQFQLVPSFEWQLFIVFCLVGVAMATTYIVSKEKCHASAISLLSESGV